MQAFLLAAMPAQLHVLRVFTSEDGSGGNPLGVFLEGAAVPPSERQASRRARLQRDGVRGRPRRAARSGSSPPPWSFRSPATPPSDTAWLLAREHGGRRRAAAARRRGARARSSGDEAFVTADPAWAPPSTGSSSRRRPTSTRLRAAGGQRRDRLLGVAGRGRRARSGRGCSRVRYGIAEDEATGAAALRLARGSAARSRSARDGAPAAGAPGARRQRRARGRVELDELRDH